MKRTIERPVRPTLQQPDSRPTIFLGWGPRLGL
jgi:hypothetical protein